MKLYKSEPPKKISDFAKDFNFETLRPYYDTESEEAMKRIAVYDSYHKAMAYLWPEMSKEEVIQKALNTKSPCEFQSLSGLPSVWYLLYPGIFISYMAISCTSSSSLRQWSFIFICRLFLLILSRNAA